MGNWMRGTRRSWEATSILLSENDVKAVCNALRTMEKLTLTRALGDRKVTVCVMPAPSVWPVAMIVKVKAEKGLVIWAQNFESAESAMEAVQKWELT